MASPQVGYIDSESEPSTPSAAQCPTQEEGSSGEEGGRGRSLSPKHTSDGTMIRLGLICMAKKVHSKTMTSILDRMAAGGEFEIVRFEEEMILNDPVELWPVVDCTISFYSEGFPLHKAMKYAELHPDIFHLTDPATQQGLLDRRSVLFALSRNCIPTVQHIIVSRDGWRGQAEPQEFLEEEDSITVDGVRIDKPFIEKPVGSEDHNHRIYYHSRDGGGCRYLFRKHQDRSSEFHSDVSRVRREGSYVYERFVETKGGMDVKLYTLGTIAAFGETRPSPVVDGKVKRDAEGKEVREEVPLSPAEQTLAKKIVQVFRQMLCGFDILRDVDGTVYVCDVNGYSMVKHNSVYAATASDALRSIFLEEYRKRGLSRVVIPDSGRRRLRGVVVVLRHADRTPKQKIKLSVTDKELIDSVYGPGTQPDAEQIFKGDHPIGQQLVPLFEKVAGRAETTEEDRASLAAIVEVVCGKHQGLKLQFKPKCKKDDDGNLKIKELQIVCKWGGWLTEAGFLQAEMLGRRFVKRALAGKEKDVATTLTVKSNNERRVQMTAKQFVKGMMSAGVELHGETDVEVDEALLGNTSAASSLLEEGSHWVSEVLNLEDVECLREPLLHSLRDAIVAAYSEVIAPAAALKRLYEQVLEVIKHLPRDPTCCCMYNDETVTLLHNRWKSLASKFYNKKKGKFDVSQIPDIFDNVSYDACYNQHVMAPFDFYPIFVAAESLSTFVSYYEYGVTAAARLASGKAIAGRLLGDITTRVTEMINATETDRFTHVYATSESHVSALKNILYLNEISQFHVVKDVMELHFLAHIVFKAYEYPKIIQSRSSFKPGSFCSGTSPNTSISSPLLQGTDQGFMRVDDDDSPYQIEVHFSQGIDKNMFGMDTDHHINHTAVTPMIRIHNNLTVGELQKMANAAAMTQFGMRSLTHETHSDSFLRIKLDRVESQPSLKKSPGAAGGPRRATTMYRGTWGQGSNMDLPDVPLVVRSEIVSSVKGETQEETEEETEDEDEEEGGEEEGNSAA